MLVCDAQNVADKEPAVSSFCRQEYHASRLDVVFQGIGHECEKWLSPEQGFCCNQCIHGNELKKPVPGVLTFLLEFFLFGVLRQAARQESGRGSPLPSRFPQPCNIEDDRGLRFATNLYSMQSMGRFERDRLQAVF